MNKKLLLFTIFLALAGTILSLLLFRVSINLAIDPGYESFCNINEAYNCEVVAGSKYASHFGIPNFVYGFGYYLIIIVFGIYCFSARD